VGSKREEFAAKLLRAIHRAGLERSRYLQDSFEIEVEGGSRLNLENALVDYERANLFTRGAVLRAWVEFARGPTVDPVPKSIDNARPNIVPIVRDAAFFANLELQEMASGVQRPSLVEVLGGDLAVSLAYDGKRAITGLATRQLDEWGISVEEAKNSARYNLRRRTPDGLTEVADASQPRESNPPSPGYRPGAAPSLLGWRQKMRGRGCVAGLLRPPLAGKCTGEGATLGPLFDNPITSVRVDPGDGLEPSRDWFRASASAPENPGVVERAGVEPATRCMQSSAPFRRPPR
jgi:hypothetical protein